MKNKSFTIGLILCSVIVVVLFAVLFLKGYKKKVEDDMAENQNVETNADDKLVEYKAVFMVSDPENETLVNNVCNVLKERAFCISSRSKSRVSSSTRMPMPYSKLSCPSFAGEHSPYTSRLPSGRRLHSVAIKPFSPHSSQKSGIS